MDKQNEPKTRKRGKECIGCEYVLDCKGKPIEQTTPCLNFKERRKDDKYR